MDSGRINYLFEQYQSGRATEQERSEFLELFESFPNREAMTELLIGEMKQKETVMEMRPEEWQSIVESILQREKASEAPARKIFGWKKIAVAASIVGLLATGAWLIFFNQSPEQQITTAKPTGQDVQPGKDGAILTLADGRKIVLDDLQNGKITDVAVKKDNQLSYSNAETTATTQYNTMSTPKGRQFSLVLADGSKVWLNAASSIRYPVAFTGSERAVEITGEAYFEVAPSNFAQGGGQGKRPFIVSVNGVKVEVLGTHFNITAYNNESSIKTTLLEGSVKTSVVNGESVIIKPSQQAEITNSKQIVTHDNVDTEKIIAWKDNVFLFSGDDIQSVMRMIERWYDVEVEYKGNITDRHFTGIISRNNKVSEVLKMLQGTEKIKFEIDGKKIIVSK